MKTERVEKYLSQLDVIYQLTSQINEVASQAFYKLARANHLTQKGMNKRYGPAFYDLRDREAVLEVLDTDRLVISDKLEVDRNKIAEKFGERQLRNRKTRNDDVDKEAEKIRKDNKKKDPVRMFNGGMVPKELVNSQESFKQLIFLETELLKAKMELHRLAKEIHYENITI